METTFDEKKMTSTFPSGKITTDFQNARIHVTSGIYTKSIPFGRMSLRDHEQLIRKTELENKPVSELTVKEFAELNSLTL